MAGPERKSRRLEPEQKRRVAYHEVGHALVAAYSEHADPVHKISIVPRGRAALGYTLQLPTEEQFLMTRSELVDRIKGMLGGRAAEEVVFDEVSTGAENDLDHATALARQMVCMYGMSDRVGLVHVGDRQDGYLPAVPGTPPQSDCSEETIREIDIEVKKLLDDAHDDGPLHPDRAPRPARPGRTGAAQARDARRDGIQRADRPAPRLGHVAAGGNPVAP